LSTSSAARKWPLDAPGSLNERLMLVYALAAVEVI